jgi:hypothetical protein
MVISPVVKGLLGIEVTDGGWSLRLAPALPASWDRVDVTGIRAGLATYAFTLTRSHASTTIRVTSADAGSADRSRPRRLTLAPAFPTDTRMHRVTVNGTTSRPELIRVGDELRAQVAVDTAASSTEVVFTYDEGTDVEADAIEPAVGADNQGLKILRASVDANTLHLIAEGRGGRTYTLRVRSPRRLGNAAGTTVQTIGGEQRLELRFEGNPAGYVRREISVPLSPR